MLANATFAKFLFCLGSARETKYYWPEEKCGDDGSLLESSRTILDAGETAYMSDQLGLHRVENESHTARLCSLHLYSPPFSDCNVSMISVI